MLAVIATGSGRLTGFGFGWGEADDNGCELTEEPSEGAEVMVRAECHWDNIPLSRLEDLLGDPALHEQFFSNVAKSAILEEAGGVTTVHQVHQASGMSDREIIVEYRVEEVQGGYKYHWQKAADQSATSGDNVVVESSTGYWEIVKEGNGVRVSYQVRYLPGGNIPAFLVRMFQSSGMQAVLAELRTTAESDIVIVRAN